jgi:small-conductance mechanosensitive channel
LAFGDTALEFELRCVVADVEKALSVRSDLNYAIIKRFREAAIEISHQQRERAEQPDKDRTGPFSWSFQPSSDGGESRKL